MKYEQYEHHGKQVWVRSDLKGKHRKHCLCMVCKKINIVDRDKNCPIAQILFNNAVKFNLVTPVWECPEFESKIKEENAVIACGECD